MSERDERIEYLVERHAAGKLDNDDIAELSKLCEDPESAREFVKDSSAPTPALSKACV